ncbi:MAG: ferrochelatase [Proteobacteria bacterium]|nr:MAG: ferrochelatase [Pseudomonadota bacterium]
MSRYSHDEQFFHGKQESLGVLLVNLGTPDEPTAPAVKKYLKQFLSDGRVVEIPRIVWWFILHGFVLRRRPAVSAEQYVSVWTDKGSPLLVQSENIRQSLQQEMSVRFDGPVHVELAMRYGNPSLVVGLRNLRHKGVRRLLVLPLYPQYSATTTATTYDAVSAEMRRWRCLPEIRFVNQYHDNERYIGSLARSIERHWAEHGRKEKLLMSFHGLPKRNLDLGDPYHCQCLKTGRLLAEKLGLKQGEWLVTFQSRFGRAEWLQPYTDKTLEKLAKEGVRRVDVVCPGFPADCLETLGEIGMEYCELFKEAGGEEYCYIPALNDDSEHIQCLADLVQQHTQGWPEVDPGWNGLSNEEKSKQTQALAKGMGAKL